MRTHALTPLGAEGESPGRAGAFAFAGSRGAPPLRRFGTLAAMLATLLAGAAMARPATPSPSCADALLRELGWRIEFADIVAAEIHGGAPCRRGSLREAQALGDLRARLPLRAGEDPAGWQRLLDDPATLCAYAFRLGEATRAAVARLDGNPGYRFTTLQAGWIAFGAGGARAQGWTPFRSLGRGYQPSGGNSRAIDAFYRGRVRSECGVGRQVAQLATQRELYGDAGFDAAFSPGELSIGTFRTLHDTDSILLGKHAGDFLADGKAVASAALGRQAFMGVPGFLEHARPLRFVDDISNRAENFVVVDVSAGAAQALAAHGGLAAYDASNRRLWQLARQMEGPARPRFEALLVDRDPALRARLGPARRSVLAQMEQLLDDPFYRGFMVYVHPMGVRPIGYHLVRLLDRNPRTPFNIELALHNLHATLYRRWIDYRLAQCGGATGATIR